MTSLISTLFLFSVLIPTKLWYSPGQPILIDVKVESPVNVTLTDFDGKPVPSQLDTRVVAPKQIDLAQLYAGLSPGTYLLSAVPEDKSKAFVGTPLVIEVRADKQHNGSTLVTHIEPLRYGEMETDAGKMTIAFYYDVAPNTVANFQALAEQGYFDGIGFHRIIPGFVVQGGDPLSLDTQRAGTGGPGYTINAEFSDRPHVRGALSMARQGDSGEAAGNPPGYQAANSASSQFFICLDYARTQSLDRKYTVFGQVTDGEETIAKLAATPSLPNTDRPAHVPLIRKLTLKPVTAENNPYAKLPKR